MQVNRENESVWVLTRPEVVRPNSAPECDGISRVRWPVVSQMQLTSGVHTLRSANYRRDDSRKLRRAQLLAQMVGALVVSVEICAFFRAGRARLDEKNDTRHCHWLIRFKAVR